MRIIRSSCVLFSIGSDNYISGASCLNRYYPTTPSRPADFLKAIEAIDQRAAVRVADKWENSANTEEYDAAYALMSRQTAVRKCAFCGWALVKHHDDCEKNLALEHR